MPYNRTRLYMLVGILIGMTGCFLLDRCTDVPMRPAMVRQ